MSQPSNSKSPRTPRGNASSQESRSPARSTRSSARSALSQLSGVAALPNSPSQQQPPSASGSPIIGSPRIPAGRTTRSSVGRNGTNSLFEKEQNRDPRSPLAASVDPRSPLASSEVMDTGVGGLDSTLSSPLSYSSAGGSRAFGSARSRMTASPRTPGRADLDAGTRHHRTLQLDPIAENMEQDDNPDTRARVVVWGTDIEVAKVQEAFQRFLRTFRVQTPDEDELAMQSGAANDDEIDPNKPYYLQRLDEINLTEEPYLNLNLHHIKLFNETLYAQIITYPAEIIPYLDMTAGDVFKDIHRASGMTDPIQLRPFNADKTRNMRGLNPEDIDSLITVSGMVTRTSTLIPDMRTGFFECNVCRFTKEVDVERGRIEEPLLCEQCNTNHCFSLIHNRSSFLDKQMVKLQELPDDMPAGQTPHTVTLYCHGDLVDTVMPGDRVTVTGVYRAMPLRTNPRVTTIKSIYKTYIDVIHFRKMDVSRFHGEMDGAHLTAERIDQIIELSNKPDVYERLAHALAPGIYEHDDIKKGILCLLFGGTRKDLSNVGRGKFRSDINMLLCGDPGTSKSQLLQYVHHMVPRSQYTSGKGSSAVGLTAYVTKDAETHQLVLQTGALVLSDKGVCCIDEFDKMNDSTRSVLHEVMEQQTLSIAKAGIICQLNARASILASANPVDSQWNKEKTIVENLQLPHTLLSRFDLIFLMVDPQDEYYDSRLAKHLVSLYYKTEEEEAEEFLDLSLMRDYISYAKANIFPKLSEEASQLLIELYLEMREAGGPGQVSAFPRQLESLIRISEAHAKIRLSSWVEVSDVREARRLYGEALKQAAVDPLTGKINMDIIALGQSASTRKNIDELTEAIKQKLMGRRGAITVKALLQDLRNTSAKEVTRAIFEETINDMVKKEILVRDTNDRVKLMPRMQVGDD